MDQLESQANGRNLCLQRQITQTSKCFVYFMRNVDIIHLHWFLVYVWGRYLVHLWNIEQLQSVFPDSQTIAFQMFSNYFSNFVKNWESIHSRRPCFPNFPPESGCRTSANYQNCHLNFHLSIGPTSFEQNWNHQVIKPKVFFHINNETRFLSLVVIKKNKRRIRPLRQY